jgi:hypothetical protein
MQLLLFRLGRRVIRILLPCTSSSHTLDAMGSDAPRTRPAISWSRVVFGSSMVGGCIRAGVIVVAAVAASAFLLPSVRLLHNTTQQ